MDLVLVRTYLANGTNGTFYFNSRPVCFSIELPWHNNAPQRSCIPEGRYRLKLRYSLRFKTHLLVEGVRGRTLILIHPANNALKELQGCIAPVTQLTGEGQGILSRKAFEKVIAIVMDQIDKQQVFLTIKSK